MNEENVQVMGVGVIGSTERNLQRVTHPGAGQARDKFSNEMSRTCYGCLGKGGLVSVEES